jgi:DNA mismatch repair ATPase MutS
VRAVRSGRELHGKRNFTHYKREEDATMTSGKFDEELSRMSEIADEIRPRSLLLCNESFASTNEREGAEIRDRACHARQVDQSPVRNPLV